MRGQGRALHVALGSLRNWSIEIGFSLGRTSIDLSPGSAMRCAWNKAIESVERQNHVCSFSDVS